MKEDAFAMLTPADWQLLRSHMSPTAFARGALLLREGARERRLLILREGSVRVERLMQGRSIVLRELGPGEVLGEIGFVENAPASASVVAQEACTADVIEGDMVQSLIATEPGFAVRFYHSLAVALARRTRADDVARMAAEAARARVPLPRTGNLSPRQLPPVLDEGLQAFERDMLAARNALRRGASAAAEAPRVAAACDAVLALLESCTLDEAVVDIGYSDLLAFRDPGTIEAGIGDTVYRETFGTFMLSATMARCHARPRGFAEDHETSAMFHRNQAAGDDWTGPLIDRWFLDRPLACSRRAAAARVSEVLRRAAAEHGPGLRVTSLACGHAAELFDFFERAPQALVSIRCVDLDAQALLAASQRAQLAGLDGRLAFVLCPALSADDAPLSPHPQHLVYALGLCEYLDDDQVVALLDHCHEQLAPGGQVLLDNLASGQPDRLLMQHLLDWPAHHRSPEDLRALWERSAFADQSPTIDLDAARVSLFLRGSRAGAS